EAYFGRAMEGYYAVPSPLFPIGNFGPRIETDDGYRVYYIMAAIQGPDGAFRFAAPEILRSNLAHELAHSFLNPIL
ncbi:MAG: DUF4932 domain-containing protein, partial [Gemmatimonadetes bacterium]|nr:DUF4932 domain-containing protein [Gemmatimonadota bacterium]NIT66708.1 DUF4932 domain-containing protein [Gemmatimonadota bacterium]NIV23325.1 DUF4932 domain-containing protein [Gemmatimonadota bacterium]NIW75139.1 DUF4932 domain-containing protein [Gemmatimonadota bacterium]NIY35285.1 DUF4932 domain-containing protein [Gemmatimonadota bacterium]